MKILTKSSRNVILEKEDFIINNLFESTNANKSILWIKKKK